MVLDLDETLIHSQLDGAHPAAAFAPRSKEPYDFIVRVEIDRHPVRFFVHKRPHVDYFLSIVRRFQMNLIFPLTLFPYW